MNDIHRKTYELLRRTSYKYSQPNYQRNQTWPRENTTFQYQNYCSDYPKNNFSTTLNKMPSSFNQAILGNSARSDHNFNYTFTPLSNKHQREQSKNKTFYPVHPVGSHCLINNKNTNNIQYKPATDAPLSRKEKSPIPSIMNHKSNQYHYKYQFNSQEKTPSGKPKWIINIDINKTLIFGDCLQNQTYESSLWNIIAQCSWGEIDQTTNMWKLSTSELSLEQPRNNLITYLNYLKKQFPKKTKSEIPDDKARNEYNHNIKAKWNNIIDDFIKQGQPGEALSSQYESIWTKWKLPEKITSKIKTDPEYKDFIEIYKDGYYFIFLSLFFAMITLTKNHRDFAIIFRTFGQDYDWVTKEFNAFCRGKHPIFDNSSPLFPKYYFDGTHGSKNFLLGTKNVGMFFRKGSDMNYTSLLIGTIERIPNITYDNIESHYKTMLDLGDCSLIKGGINIYKYIEKEIVYGEVHSFVMNDNYDIWFTNEEKAEFGKPIFVNPYDKKVLYLFFDDNIRPGENSIVDCRNIFTGKTMKYGTIINQIIVKVNPINAGVDKDYFYRIITECEMKRKGDDINNGGEGKKEGDEKKLFKYLEEAVDYYGKYKRDCGERSWGEFVEYYWKIKSVDI